MTDPFLKIQELIKDNQHQKALELINTQDWPLHLQIQKHSWKAQTLFQLHQTKEALDEIIFAIRIAKKEDNQIAYRDLKTLQSQIISVDVAQKAMIEKQKQVTPIAEALKRFSLQPKIAIEQLQLLKRIADDTSDTKQQVLTRLALAQSENLRALVLEEAQQIADKSGDHNLITAVKKTYLQFNIPITPHIF